MFPFCYSSPLEVCLDGARSSRQYRVMLRKYVEVGSRISRLEKVMALLVESGVVYCLLWVSATYL